jgi:hypothetical protein
MSDQEAKVLAIEVLRFLGMEAEELPCKETETADIHAWGLQCDVFLEIKTKSDDQSRLAELATSENTESVLWQVDPIAARTAFNTHLRKAEKQLAASATSADAFRFAFLWLRERDPDLLWRQAFETFFGRADLGAPGARECVTCFYFDHSSCFSCPGIDGMFLVEVDTRGVGLHLCLNEYSPRYEAIRTSALVEAIKQIGFRVFDPYEMEDNGEIVAYRGNLSRSDHDGILAELSKSHGAEYRLAPKLNRHRPWFRGGEDAEAAT